MFTPWTRLCAGKHSLKTVCLLPEVAYEWQGIFKQRKWKGRWQKKDSFCFLWALKFFLVTRNSTILQLALKISSHNLRKANKIHTSKLSYSAFLPKLLHHRYTQAMHWSFYLKYSQGLMPQYCRDTKPPLSPLRYSEKTQCAC